MPRICLYLQLHQPYRLSEYSVFEIGSAPQYFEQAAHNSNEAIFRKVTTKSYRPMLKVLLKLVRQFPEFHVSLSCSGVFLEQAQAWEPEVIELIKSLVATGQVELLAETYYHSLASLYSPTEFAEQVAAQTELVQQLFGVRPTVFRNTELIYSDYVAHQVQALGFKAQLTEAVDRYLAGHTKTQVWRAVGTTGSSPLPLLLKHAQLSDDIAFRFSDRNWKWYPLSPERYLEWLSAYGRDELINLFMDFETFGEHQWAETGIFEFFQRLVQFTLERSDCRWLTPSEVVAELTPAQLNQAPVYHVPEPISWADVDRDLTAWTENELQQDTLRLIYELEGAVRASQDAQLLADWRRLQTSDHFYYMCTKWAADGDVHAYFSPYDTPYEAYRRYATVLSDLAQRVRQATVARELLVATAETL